MAVLVGGVWQTGAVLGSYGRGRDEQGGLSSCLLVSEEGIPMIIISCDPCSWGYTSHLFFNRPDVAGAVL